MSEREEMLQRIRRALQRSSDTPPSRPVVWAPLPPGSQQLSTAQELIDKFELEFTRVGGKPYRAGDLSQLETILLSLLEGRQNSSVVLSAQPLLEKLCIIKMLRSYGGRVWAWEAGSENSSGGQFEGRFRREAFRAEVGVTGVDWVLAETGTLVLSSQTEGSQLTSLAPPVHVALYRANQVVANLEDILDQLALGGEGAPAPGRSIVFITGSSRTGDIELTLTVGVHGPQEVHAILLGEGCFSL